MSKIIKKKKSRTVLGNTGDLRRFRVFKADLKL